jgi:hypothetical protein
VASYAIRYRASAATGDFGALTTLYRATARTGTTFAGTPGRTYCFSGMATDRWANQSAWSGDRCTVLPFDDRALTPSTGWTRQWAPGFYLGSALATSRKWAALTREALQAHRIRVLAETCPTCGQIRVRWNNEVVGTFDLVSKTTLHQRLLAEVILPAVQTGTLQIRVISAHRPVVIDGVAVTRL